MNKQEKSQALSLAEHHFSNNNYPVAEQILKKIIATDPANSKANELLAYIYGNQGQTEHALHLLKRACKSKDSSPEAHYYLGMALLKADRHEEAITAFLAAIDKAGEFFEALHDLGTAHGHLNNKTKALHYYQKALKYRDDSYELHYNLARLYDDFKKFDDAIIHYQKAIALKPDYAEAWSNLGVTLHDLKRYNEALTHYDKAIALKPDYAHAWSNKAATLNVLNRSDEAVVHFRKALQLNPESEFVLGDYVSTKMKLCDWESFNEILNKCITGIGHSKRVSTPFPLLALVDDPALHRQCADIYVKKENSLPQPPHRFKKKSPNEKIRIGYYSADFHNHATMYLMAELFAAHDRDKFDIYGFSFGPEQNDEMRQRVAGAFKEFHVVNHLSDMEIVNLSRTLAIDIAVDLKGHTQHARTAIFALGCAPIQVNYLGYPGTLGAEFMQYIVADKTVIPLEAQTHYTEKVVYLPDCFQVNDSTRNISDKNYSKHELGLPENSFVFCCFNNNYKIVPAVFDIWITILKSVAHSVLWLLEDNPTVVTNLRKEAAVRGISSDRLIFAKRMPNSEHLARQKAADLFLDTLPYNAHTTASDALWAGLPVLTCMGASFASRVAGSLLHALVLPELITTSLAQYQTKAIELATHPEKLNALKTRLAQNRLSAPVFKGKVFARHLESAYAAMYSRYLNNLPPAMIDLSDDNKFDLTA